MTLKQVWRVIYCFISIILLASALSYAEDERINLKLDSDRIFSLLTGLRLNIPKEEKTRNDLITKIGSSASNRRERGRESLEMPSKRVKQAEIKALKVRRVVAIQN